MFLILISSSIVIAQEQNLQYDRNGNLVTGDSYYREYNGFNQLIRIRNNSQTGQIIEEFTWHPVEERILIKDIFYKGIKNYTIYYVTPEYIVIENKTGNYTEKYVYQDNNLVAQVNTNGQKQFLHNDHEGSSTLITDLSGNTVETSFYSPFGEILGGGSSSRFDYEAKEYDFLVNDVDFHFRRYKPEWGKFTQPDDRIEKFYNPQELNRYSFEGNNPQKYTDPDGHYISPIDVVDYISFADSADKYNQDPSAENLVILGLDGISVAIPGLGGLGATVKAVKYGSQVADIKQIKQAAEQVTQPIKSADTAKDVAKTIDSGQKFLKFTQGNFRDNLAILTGKNPKGYQAHHILPQALEREFKRLYGKDFNIHDPKYGAWVKGGIHQSWSKRYEAEWRRFLRTNPSLRATEKKAIELAKKYGYEVHI